MKRVFIIIQICLNSTAFAPPQARKQRKQKQDAPKIDGISKFYDLEFSDEGAKVWRFYGIGKGITLNTESWKNKYNRAVFCS